MIMSGAEKKKNYNAYIGQPSQPSQVKEKSLNIKEKKAARVDSELSQTLANPRKAPGAAKKAKKKPAKKRTRKIKPRTAADRRLSERIAASGDDRAMAGARRYIDMIEAMYRRRQLNARQYQAASRYRDAAEAASRGVPCALDTSRIRGGNGAGSPTETQLWGAGVLHRAQQLLGKSQGLIVTLAVVEGMTFHEIAGALFRRGVDGRVKRGDAEYAGRTLREALTMLADAWWPAAPKGRIRAVRPVAAQPPASPRTGAVTPGVVAHARAGRVRWTDPDKREKEG
jgi:hypothetical protein